MSAKAKVGVNGPPAQIRDLNFEVTAFKTNSPVDGHEMLGFFIDDGGTLQFLTETTLSRASGKYGQKLNIEVPELAQHVGAYDNGLGRCNYHARQEEGPATPSSGPSAARRRSIRSRSI